MSYFKKKSGFTLAEIVITIGVLSAIFSSTAFVLHSLGRAPSLYEDRFSVARIIKDTAIGTRSIARNDFSLLQNGTYGLAYSNGSWSLVSGSDTVGIFNRSITVSDAIDGGKDIATSLSWISKGVAKQESFRDRVYNKNQSTTLADSIVINASAPSIASATVRNIFVQNTNTNPITITHMRITFSNAARRLLRLRFVSPNTIVWSSTGPGNPLGTQQSGTLIDIADYVLPANAQKEMLVIFNGSISPSTFSVELTFSDGSKKLVNF